MVIILYAIFASSILISKTIMPYTGLMFLTGARMVIGGGLLMAFQYFSPSQKFIFKKEHFKYYAQLAIFNILITYTARYWALITLPAFKVSFLHNLAPFITAFYAYAFLKDRMSKKQWVGLGIGLLGMIPILITTTPGEASMGEVFFISLPELAAIASVAASCYGWIIMRKLIKENGYSPMMANGISMTLGGILSLAISLPLEGFYPVTNSTIFWTQLFAVILVSNIICHNLYGHLLRTYSPTLLSFAGFITPFFAAFYEWVLNGQTITWHFYASSIIVFAGLFLFYKDELYHQRLAD
jgi:drug/metabolite transporter (DMT)-like permease